MYDDKHVIWPSYHIRTCRRRMMRQVQFLAVTILICLTATTASARHFVNSNVGTDAGDCTDQLNPCLNIGYAIQQAFDAEMIPNIVVLQVDPASQPTTYELSAGLSITSDAPSNNHLRIEGEGSNPSEIEIVQLGTDRHFSFNGGTIVEIRNLTLSGGNSATNGGSIEHLDGGRLKLKDVVFRSNAAQGDGGAIEMDGDLIAVDTIFENNSANGGLSNNGFGGAIRLLSGSARIRDSEFDSNSAADSGGAVSVQNGSLVLDGVTMNENRAELYGGAVHCLVDPDSQCTSLRIRRESQFARNEAGNSGGAIFTNGDTTISDSEFLENVAEEMPLLAGFGLGGAVFANISAAGNDRLLIVSSEFIGNFAEGRGGAVSSLSTATARIIGSTFDGNASGVTGGAISWDGNGTPLNVVNSTFLGNLAELGGGAIEFVPAIPAGTDTHRLLSLTLVNNASTQGAQDITGAAEVDNMSYVLIDHGDGPAGAAPECDTNIGGGGESNLVSDGVGTSCGQGAFLVIGDSGDLGDLVDNGGRTRTIAILDTSSAARNPGGNGCVRPGGDPLQVDQRGEPRDANCDVGAYEHRGLNLTGSDGPQQISSR